jgi:hypothetical protein
MGREIKRVPVDFDWPINKIWSGYLWPDSLQSAPCPAGDACLNGHTAAGAWVGEIAHLALMLDDDLGSQQRGHRMHPYFDSVPRPYGSSSMRSDVRPSPDIAEFGAGLAGRSGSFMGHDAIDRWRATDALIRAAGLDPKTWGICPECQGHGSVEAYPGQRADAEAWQSTEPPAGEGWQLWETVSEGSPISPVFPDAEGLAQWLTTPDACWGAMSRPMMIEQARGFVRTGWAPSVVGNAGGVHDGATFIGTKEALGGEW